MPRKRSTGRARGTSSLNQLQRQIQKTNQRLAQLERARLQGKFASRKLVATIKDTDKFKYSKAKLKPIKLVGTLSPEEQRLYAKQFNKFLRSQTSTVLGIKSVEGRTKLSIQRTLSVKDEEITMEDVEFYYSMFGDDDFDFFSDKIGASELWAIVADVKEVNGSYNYFEDRLKQYITINDEETRKKAIRFYNKYCG